MASEDLRKARFPYHAPKSRAQHLRPVKMEDEGTEGKVARLGWLSDGEIRDSELGLPLSGPGGPRRAPADTLMAMLIDKPYVKAFNRTYGALAAQHPEYDLQDPDMMSNYEKQLVSAYSADQAAQSRANELRILVRGAPARCAKIPLDAHLHTWGGAIPYLANDIFPEDDGAAAPPKPARWRPRTGVHGDVNATAPDQAAIIRPVQFRSLAEAEAKDTALSRDCATTPLIFPPGGRRTESRLIDLPGQTRDPTVSQCVKRFFDPSVGIPFVPADVALYFPVALLVPEPPLEVEADDLVLDAQPEPEPPTTLLNTSQEDVLFTKNKAPFTRADISSVRAFGRHWDRLKMRKHDQAVRAMRDREKLIKQTFHSKTRLETTLGLIEQDCQRIRSGLLGKGAFKHKSIWQTALANAPPDHSGLEERRELWWRFCAFVRFVGGIQEELEKDFVRLIRLKLMLRHQVDMTLFWDIVKEVPPAALESVAVLRLVEFVRLVLNVDRDEFCDFFADMKVAQIMYSQTIMTNQSKEFLDKQLQIARAPIAVPESE
jgi:hypothetical protein